MSEVTQGTSSPLPDCKSDIMNNNNNNCERGSDEIKKLAKAVDSVVVAKLASQANSNQASQADRDLKTCHMDCKNDSHVQGEYYCFGNFLIENLNIFLMCTHVWICEIWVKKRNIFNHNIY